MYVAFQYKQDNNTSLTYFVLMDTGYLYPPGIHQPPASLPTYKIGIILV